MPNIMQTGAAWHAEQRKLHSGIEVVYRHGASVLDLTLIPRRNNTERAGRDLLRDDGIVIRTDDFAGVVADLEFEDVAFLPEFPDEIEWTDEAGEQHTSIVFPRVNGRAFNFTGPTKKQLLIHTVDADGLAEIEVEFAGQLPFTAKGVLGPIRGVTDFDNFGAESRILTAVVYIPTVALAAQHITHPPATASFGCYGLEGWAIEMGQTDWGVGLVKLGLQRETLVREWQARRNAAV